MFYQCHIFNENPTSLRELWNTVLFTQLLTESMDFHLRLAYFSQLLYSHVCIYYLGAFSVIERSWWESWEKEMEVRVAGVAGVFIFGGNEDWSGWCKWTSHWNALNQNHCLIWPSPRWNPQHPQKKQHNFELFFLISQNALKYLSALT